MLISKSPQASPWTQALAKEVVKPIFPFISPQLRPFLLALTLFAIASALMFVGDAAMLRYGFPWVLVSLLVVVVAANLWGVRPALLVLTLAAAYGVLVVPRLQLAAFLPTIPPWHVLMVRTILFVACGIVTVWLTDRAQVMQGKAETRRRVVTALRSTILPGTLAEAPGYDLSSVYKPLHQEEEVGGDFYDFYPIEPGRYGLMIGDVVGKGKEAASSIALLRYSVRAFSSTGARPAWIMQQLSSMIETQGLQFEMASLFLGFLDTQSGLLSYANAGHEPPLLRRADGEEEALDSTGPILGINLDMPYDENVISLGLEDALLLMTDGVTEARNGQGEFLDSTGAWRLLRSALPAASSEQALASFDQDLNRYIGPNHSDDIALLLLRRTSGSLDAPETRDMVKLRKDSTDGRCFAWRKGDQ